MAYKKVKIHILYIKNILILYSLEFISYIT